MVFQWLVETGTAHAITLACRWMVRRKCKKGSKIMALRFENAARYLVSLAGAAAFTVVMIANTVSLGPVA